MQGHGGEQFGDRNQAHCAGRDNTISAKLVHQLSCGGLQVDTSQQLWGHDIEQSDLCRESQHSAGKSA